MADDDITKFLHKEMIDEHMDQVYAGVTQASGAIAATYKPGPRVSSNIEDARPQQWEDAVDEYDARKREERGEFKGYYTQGPDDNVLRESNRFRGQSGNMKSMQEDLDALMRSKGMKLGGPEEIEESKDLYAQLGDWIADNGPDNPGKFMAQVVWKLGDMFVADPVRAAESILKGPVKLPSQMTNEEAAGALGKGVQAVGGALAGGIPAHLSEGLTGAYLGSLGGKAGKTLVDRARQVENSIEGNTKRLAKLQEEVSSDRFTPKIIGMKQETIAALEARLEKLYAEKEDLTSAGFYHKLYSNRAPETNVPAAPDIGQRSPNFPARPEDRVEARMTVKDRKLLDKIETLEMTASMHKDVARRRAAREELENIYRQRDLSSK